MVRLKEQLSVVLLLLTLTSCSTNVEYKPYRLPQNADSLLTGGQKKVWKLAKRLNNDTRVNMGECTIGYRQTFLADHTVTDNNSDMYDCGKSMNGTWRLGENRNGASFLSITSDMVPQYFKVPDGSKTKNFQLIKLTEGVLIYTFKHELFSTKTSIVTDILVPQDSIVDDRNFHW